MFTSFRYRFGKTTPPINENNYPNLGDRATCDFPVPSITFIVAERNFGEYSETTTCDFPTPSITLYDSTRVIVIPEEAASSNVTFKFTLKEANVDVGTINESASSNTTVKITLQ